MGYKTELGLVQTYLGETIMLTSFFILLFVFLKWADDCPLSWEQQSIPFSSYSWMDIYFPQMHIFFFSLIFLSMFVSFFFGGKVEKGGGPAAQLRKKKPKEGPRAWQVRHPLLDPIPTLVQILPKEK